MKQTSFPMKPDGKLTIHCGADLSVEGIEAATMVVIVDHSEGLRMREEGGVFSLQTDSDCRVILPFGVTVTIDKVGGDASIKNLSNRLVIGKVGGDLQLNLVEGASVETVGGDCIVKQTSGAAELNRIGGDLVAEVSGSIYAGSVGGDARVIGATGKVQLTAGGDTSFKFTDANMPEVKVNAGGDIQLQVPADANAQLELTSEDENIQVHSSGQDVDAEERNFSLPLGNGGATVTLTAGGSINVTDREEKDWDFDTEVESMDDRWQDFGIEIEQKIKESLKTVADSVRMATQQASKAGQIAEEKMNQAMRHLEERGMSAGRKRKVVGFTFGENDPFTVKPPVRASDEERMLVLRMLQEKKISVEEAEKLLNALDR
jgi:hypothetical protein